jgi:mannose-6-phosphate isomerase-like protein (cupin superfamily)
MAGWSTSRLEDAPDVLGDYPGEMRFLSRALGTEQVAFTHRRMPAQSGGKGSYGHRHRTQEEVYFVLSGHLEAKVEDEVIELGPQSALRVAPGVARSLWNEGPEDVVLVIVSTRLDSLAGEIEKVEDFWPA